MWKKKSKRLEKVRDKRFVKKWIPKQSKHYLWCTLHFCIWKQEFMYVCEEDAVQSKVLCPCFSSCPKKWNFPALMVKENGLLFLKAQ